MAHSDCAAVATQAGYAAASSAVPAAWADCSSMAVTAQGLVVLLLLPWWLHGLVVLFLLLQQPHGSVVLLPRLQH